MFGWGERRGSAGRAAHSNRDTEFERTSRGERRGYATPEPNEVIVYVREPRPISELLMIVAFTGGLVITAVAVLMALSFEAGTGTPFQVNVDHVASCLPGNYADLAAQAQQLLPLDRSERSGHSKQDDEDDGTGSSITIYVPCRLDRDRRGSYGGDYNSESYSGSGSTIVVGGGSQ